MFKRSFFLTHPYFHVLFQNRLKGTAGNRSKWCSFESPCSWSPPSGAPERDRVFLHLLPSVRITAMNITQPHCAQDRGQMGQVVPPCSCPLRGWTRANHNGQWGHQLSFLTSNSTLTQRRWHAGPSLPLLSHRPLWQKQPWGLFFF